MLNSFAFALTVTRLKNDKILLFSRKISNYIFIGIAKNKHIPYTSSRC